MFKWLSRRTKTDSPPKSLDVGEVHGDYIGCYLFWFTIRGEDEPSYQSLATTMDQLVADYTSFFAAIVESKEQLLAQMPKRRPSSETYRTEDGGLVIPTDDLIRNGHEADLKVAKNCLNHTDWIDRHLNSDKKSPFITLGGMQVWLDTGNRERQKIAGKHIE